MNDAAPLAAFARCLPKAELHVHLEGSIPPELAVRLAGRHGVRLPGADRGADGVREAFRFVDFRRFIEVYIALSRCLQTVDDLREVVVVLADRLASQGVAHAEVTFTPMTHIARGVPVDTLVEGLVQGRDAARERGVSIAYVTDIVRSFADQAEPTLAFALTLQRRIDAGVAGLGLAGPEGGDHPVEPMVEVFARARAAGLRSLPHAGEFLGPHSVRAAIELLGASRIGHGVRAIEDPRLVDEIVARGIWLEVCPSSNVALGVYPSLAVHPLPRLMAAGVQVTIATDDPALFGVDLVDELVRCAAAYGWDEATVRGLAVASWRAATLPHAEIDGRIASLQRVASGNLYGEDS